MRDNTTVCKIKIIKEISVISVVIILSLLMVSCDSNEVSSASLSGRVSLENQEDASDVYVAVYDLVELDPVIVDANNRWPQIGVIIDQKTEFDHRLQEPIAYTQSDATGSYELKDIPIGEYNIVFYKAGWGFRYILNYQVDKGENPVDDIELYEETLLDGDISTGIIMQDAHHYIIEGNANIVPGAKLTIEAGAVVRINPGKALNIWGEIQAQGIEENMFWITSNDGFDEFGIKHEPEEIDRYNQIMLEDGVTITEDLINYGRFDFGTYALNSSGNYFKTENCRFKYSACGFQAMSADSMRVSNCNFTYTDGNSGGIFFSGILNGRVANLICTSNVIGMRLKDRFDGIAENNYLAYSTYGFEGVHFMGVFQHNELEHNSISDMHVAGTIGSVHEPMEIYYNNFNSDTGILGYYDWGGVYGVFCMIEAINDNNFFNEIFINCITSNVEMSSNARNNLYCKRILAWSQVDLHCLGGIKCYLLLASYTTKAKPQEYRNSRKGKDLTKH